MKLVAAGLSHDIHGGAFAATVDCRKALCADHEFLNRFERKLHHRPADGVIFIVNSVNCNVYVTAARSIHGEHGYAALRWRSEERRVGKECRSGWWPYE